MENIALASIKTFGLLGDHVQPDDPIVLTRGELQTIVRAAIQPLIERIGALETALDELQALHEVYHGPAPDPLEMQLVRDAIERQREVQALLPHRVCDLEKQILAAQERRPRKKELARAEKIRRYLQSQPNRKANFESLKGVLGIDGTRLNEAIKSLMREEPGRYGIMKPNSGDKRKRVLVMLPR